MKKLLTGILMLVVLFSFVGCNTSGSTPSVEEGGENVVNQDEPKTSEDDFWNYLVALYGNYDILEASKYSYFDVEKIYEDVIVKTSNSLDITTDRVYVNIQSRLKNSSVNDYESFMKAYAAIMKEEDPVDETTVNNEISEYKKIYKKAVLSDTEIIDFKKHIYLMCDSLKESRNIDISEYISFDDIEEYKIITIQEEASADEKEAGVQHGVLIYYIVKTPSGWKVFDFTILASLEVINEEIWNIYD